MAKEEICIVGMTYHYVKMETHNYNSEEILKAYENGNYEEIEPLETSDRFPVYTKKSYIPGMKGPLVEPIIGLCGIFDKLDRDGIPIFGEPPISNAKAKARIVDRVVSVLHRLGQSNTAHILLVHAEEKNLKELLEFMEKELLIHIYLDDESREILEKRDMMSHK